MTFNPSATDVVGLEWPVIRQGGTRLANNNDAAAAGFTSSSAQTVTALGAYFSQVVGAPSFAVDVWPLSSLPSSVTTDTFRPNEDVTDTNILGVSVNTAGNLHTNIDESTLDEADYVRQDTGGTPTKFVFRVASGAASTPFVYALRVHAVVSATNTRTLQIGLNLGGTEYYTAAQTLAVADGVTTIEGLWEKNPSTGARWTQAEIRLFDTTDEVVLLWENQGGIFVHQAWMEVDHSAAPSATGAVSPTADGWATVTLDASWSKANATAYVVVCRKTNGAGSAVWNLVDSAAACPHVSHVSYVPTIADYGVVSALNTSATGAHAWTMTVGGAAADDSQPYATLTAEPVYSGRTVEQEFTPTATITAGNIAATVARQSATTDGDLLLKIRRRSDSAQIGGTVTITAADVATSIRKLRQVVGAMASTGSTTASTQYYIEASSTATSGSGWVVAVADSEGSGGTAGFGSTTDAATVAAVEDTSADLAGFVGVAPATVTNPAVSETGSGTTTAATLTWTAVTDTDFAAYEILRGGVLVAELATKATASWADYEARVGVQESYQIRQRYDDGRLGALTTAVTVTITDTTSRLVSNHNPSLNVELDITAPLTRTVFQDRSEYEPLGRDFVVVHRGSQDRGTELSLNVRFVAADDLVDLFADLVAATQADVPHLAIVTEWGDRWFVTAAYTSDSTQHLGYGTSTVRAREVAPTPVDG